MKCKFLFFPILLLFVAASPSYGQSSIEIVKADCPEVIIKDSLTFVFKDWIKKEIAKDSLIIQCEKAFEDTWTIPDESDSLWNIYISGSKTFFLKEMNDLQVKLKSEDRIYLYSNSVYNWNTLTGEVGIVVLRECKLIDIYIIARS